MSSRFPIKIIYCSWSPFKKEEWDIAKQHLELASMPGRKLGEVFDLEFKDVETTEPLLCNLEAMVRFKVMSAYRAVRVPCIVEHAGLILRGYEDKSFPGGLTQPMWDALRPEQFVASCAPLTVKAIARAVVGYCDGMNINTFVGDTNGHLSSAARGGRDFYWDTVFCPEGYGDKTYSEIVRDDKSGLLDKLQISQSMKALKAFMQHRLDNEPSLFPGL
jgi:inosine/xanthosine triphosphate pyrophosphatase family protein